MRGPRGDDRGLSWFVQLVALVIVATIVAGAYSQYFGYAGPPAPVVEIAESGDAVEIDYVGSFDDGRVFDTSIWEVAIDNASYPKSPGFGFRGQQSAYKPLDFFVGAGTVIRGFDDAVLGMKVGESRYVSIPPEEGYGVGDPAQRVTRDLVEELPVTEVLTFAQFEATYLISPEGLSGASLPNPTWGWNVTVHVEGELVTVRQAPVPGSTVRPHRQWDATVELVDDAADGGRGLIRVRHLLAPEMAGAISGSDYGRRFFVRSIDLAAGTWVQDFNPETTGVTLNFLITLVSLEKA